MLARERTTVALDQVRRFICEAQILLNSLVRFETEIDPRVHQPLAEMSVERAEIIVLVQ